MADETERLRTTQWILERQIGWISTADIKVGAVVAIQTAMAGLLASAFSAASTRSEYVIFSTAFSFLLTIAAFICASYALIPRTDGPDRSVIFFGKIVCFSRREYVDEMSNITYQQLIEDCAEQIHRNAEIAKEKHRWVQNGMIWTFLSAPFWIFSLLNLAPLKVT